MSDNEYLPLMEAAKYAGVSRVKLWQMVKDGKLKAYGDPRDGRVRLVKRSELDAALRPFLLEAEAKSEAAA